MKTERWVLPLLMAGVALGLSGCGANSQPVSATQVSMEEGQVSLEGPGASYDQADGLVTIDQGGSYELSGSMDGIRFLIDLEEPEPVKLILNGVDLTSPGTAAITCLNAEKLVLFLQEGSENFIQDIGGGMMEDTDGSGADALLYSEAPLILAGQGNLELLASYQIGVHADADLALWDGNLSITSNSVGILAGHVSVKDGSLALSTQGTEIEILE